MTRGGRYCDTCGCPLQLLRGERRRLCARCGGGVRAPRATLLCASPGCAGGVAPSSVSGLCITCRTSPRRRAALAAQAQDPIPESAAIPALDSGMGEGARLPPSLRRGTCETCGGPTGRGNRTGHCSVCVAAVGVCVVPGCESRTAAFSRSGLCGEHARGWRRYRVTE